MRPGSPGLQPLCFLGSTIACIGEEIIVREFVISVALGFEVRGQFPCTKSRTLLDSDVVFQEQRHIDAHYESNRRSGFRLLIKLVEAPVLRLAETRVSQFHQNLLGKHTGRDCHAGQSL